MAKHKSSALVDPAWLHRHRSRSEGEADRDRRPGAGAEAGVSRRPHPGAVCWDWKEMLWDAARRDFPAPEEFARRCGQAGIANDTTVVFYGEGMQFGIYAWWTFRYCGHRKVKVLDGARYRWAAEGRPLVTEEPPAAAPVQYDPVKRVERMRIHRDKVLAALRPDGPAILDGRSPEEYRGERVGAPGGPDVGAMRYGRIPGAQHLHFEDMLDADKCFKDAEELARMARGPGSASRARYHRLLPPEPPRDRALLRPDRAARLPEGQGVRRLVDRVGKPGRRSRGTLMKPRREVRKAYRRAKSSLLEAPLGAEVRCGDLRAATDGQIAAIRAAWLEHLVVLFRGQQFTDADLIAFGRRFGEFQYSTPLAEPARERRQGEAGRRRRALSRSDRGVQRRRGRRRAGRPGRRRAHVAHGHVELRGAAQPDDTARHRGAGGERAHRLRQHVSRLRRAARRPARARGRSHAQARRDDRRGRLCQEAVRRRARGRSRRARAQPIRWSARTRKPGATASTWGDAPRRTSSVCRSTSRKRCSTSCGRTLRSRSSPGTTTGGPATC